MALLIRLATLDDAPAMGRIHVRAWQAAYRGTMPDAYLDGLDALQRQELWRKHLSTLPKAKHVLVAERDTVLGFVVLGPESTEPIAERRAEIHALNVDPAAWSTGVGQALLHAATSRLRAESYSNAVLWVATRNARARRLYERHGWQLDGRSRGETVLAVEVEETGYVLKL